MSSNEARDAMEKVVRTKMKELGEALTAQDPRFKLISNVDISSHCYNDNFIRFTDGEAEVKIYVELGYGRSYYHDAGRDLDKYYVRLKAENYYGKDVRFGYTWTFSKTKELLQKVHDQAVTIAGRVNVHIDNETEAAARTKKAVAHINGLFGGAGSYSRDGHVSFAIEGSKRPTINAEYRLNRDAEEGYYTFKIDYLSEVAAIQIAKLLGHPLKK